MNDISETEKKSDILSRLVAISVAIAICLYMVLFSFSFPHMKVRADESSALDQFFINKTVSKLETLALTAALGQTSGSAAVLGIQLGLLVVAENMIQNPNITHDMSKWSNISGFYINNGNTYSYSMCVPSDFSGYVPSDGALTIGASSQGWLAKVQFPRVNSLSYYHDTSYQYAIIMGSNSSAFNVQVLVSAPNGIDFSSISHPFSSTSFSTSSGTYVQVGNRYMINGIPTVYNNTSLSSAFPTARNSGIQFFGYYGSSVSPYSGTYTNAVDYYNDYVLPRIIDLPIVQDHPELILFPDGIEEPTEPTTEPTTELPSYFYQPFTLPPEWLETYPMEPETFPTIPFQDVEPPTVDSDMLDGFKNGMNFWWYITKDIIDALDLEKFIALCFALVVLFFILWKLGSSGGGSGGDD